MFATMVHGRVRTAVLALLVLVGLVGSVLAVLAAPQAAHAEITGSGGQYVAQDAHLLDTRTSGGKIAANTWKTVKFAGVGGLPSSGIGAVALVLTVPDGSGLGQMVARPDASSPSTVVMTYNNENVANTSNTATVAVGKDGTVQFELQTTENLIVDVSGYYTSTANGVGPGGLVPLNGTPIADTRNGNGVPKATISAGGSITFQVTGRGGVPAGAAAVVANITVFGVDGAAGYVAPGAAGATPGAGLNYPAAKQATAMNAQIPLSSDGKITIGNAPKGGVINIAVDLEGYFVPSNPGGGYTPQAGRLLDTRTNGQTLNSGASLAFQVAGARSGVPSMQDGLSAVALTVTVKHNGTDSGFSRVWADGATEPDIASLQSPGTTFRTDTIIVPVGAGGKVRVKNVSGSATDYIIDLQGTYTSLPVGPTTTNLTGSRPSATNLSFAIDDRTSAQVDVATGNLLLTTNALTMAGVTDQLSIGAAYNSRGWEVADSAAPDANKWSYALDGAGSLANNATGVVYTGPDGST